MFIEQSIKNLSFIKIKEKVLIFSFLMVLVVYLPTVIHSQPITGSLVNMSLILAVFLIGPFGAVLLGLMPSVFALSSGLLPLSLIPMVPFIITGNAILIGVYHYLGRKNFYFSIAIAALCKFLFLFFSAGWLIKFLPDGEKMLPLVSMMSWPQFFTALSGGLMAYFVLSFIGKIKKD